MSADWFSQADACCRLEWGKRGAVAAAAREDIVVIVDVLRFSTAAAAACARDVTIYPCRNAGEAAEMAGERGAEIGGKEMLSPRHCDSLAAGTRIALVSPNGATCCCVAANAFAVIAAAPVNASSVARDVGALMQRSGRSTTIVACGERWPIHDEEGALRFAVEDYLGAGAILARLPSSLSPEARVCADAFRAAENRLAEILWECGSGIELRAKGCGEDVRFAAGIDTIDVTPILSYGGFIPFSRSLDSAAG